MAAEKIAEKAPKLSIIIACYRSGKLLYQALESVLAQSYEDFELVICDDGSEHFDAEQVRRFTEGRRVKVFHRETNRGTVYNLNAGLLSCAGEWVLLLAADDALAEGDALLKIAGRAATTPKKWMIGPAQLCDGELRPTEWTIPTEAQRDFLRRGSAQQIWGRLCRECFIPSGGVVYRRELLLSFGGFDAHYQLVEDWPLFLKLMRMGELPEVLECPVTLHRAGGVSQKAAGKNRVYQRDLIETMRTEILPYLDGLPAGERRELRTFCRDKEEIYQFRFEKTGLRAKTGWLLTHPGTILRKMMKRGVTQKPW